MVTDTIRKVELAAAVLAIVAAVLGLVFGIGFLTGAHRAELKAVAEAERIRTQQLKVVGELNDRLAAKEKEHEKFVSGLVAQYEAAGREREKSHAADVAAVRSGARPIGLRARCPAGGEAPVVGAVAASAPAHAEARVELAPETGAALVGIVNDGDDAIEQLSALQVYTQKLWNTCNKGQEP